MSEEIEKLLSYADSYDWTIERDSNGVYLEKFSPAGRDFSFYVQNKDTAEDFLESIKRFYENFDVSYEAYLWLDENGHGKNGAPYDMKDLYNDIECCKENIKELYNLFISKSRAYHTRGNGWFCYQA